MSHMEVYKKLERNIYVEPPNHEEHYAMNHWQDHNYFHIPLACMQNINLHDWGIVRGLEVSTENNGTELLVQAGIAIDRDGNLISLSEEGHGYIGNDPPGDKYAGVIVPVNLGIPNNIEDGTYYVTIVFDEFIFEDQESGNRLVQRPWLRLQSTSGDLDEYDEGRERWYRPIILAIAEIKVIGDVGKVISLKVEDSTFPYRRCLIGQSIEELRIRRGNNDDGAISEKTAGKIMPGTNGGLKITVPESDDGVLFAKEGGGTFGKLEIHTDILSTNGKVGIGTTEPFTQLHIVTKEGIDREGYGNPMVWGQHIELAATQMWGLSNLYGTLCTWESDSLFIGLKDEGTDRKDSIIAFGDNSNDSLRFMFTPFGVPTPPEPLEFMRITGTGNVGIGTTQPNEKLAVGGLGSALELGADVGDKEANAGKIAFRKWGDWLDIVGAGSNRTRKIHFWAEQGAFFNGNVGIGTNMPTIGTLQVNGNIVSARASDGTNAGFIDWYNISNNKRWHLTMRSGDGDKLQLYHHDSRVWSGPQLNINPNGNVGIGTPEPKAKLHVPEGAILNNVAIGVDPPDAAVNFRWPYETVGTISTGTNLRLHSYKSILFHVKNEQGHALRIGEDGNVYVMRNLSVGGNINTNKGSIVVADMPGVKVHYGTVYLGERDSHTQDDWVTHGESFTSKDSYFVIGKVVEDHPAYGRAVYETFECKPNSETVFRIRWKHNYGKSLPSILHYLVIGT